MRNTIGVSTLLPLWWNNRPARSSWSSLLHDYGSLLHQYYFTSGLCPRQRSSKPGIFLFSLYRWITIRWYESYTMEDELALCMRRHVRWLIVPFPSYFIEGLHKEYNICTVLTVDRTYVLRPEGWFISRSKIKYSLMSQCNQRFR